MSRPRQIVPGATVFVTRRCTQRQFLLKPSRLVNQVFLYCLAYAAARHGILVHAFIVMSNHFLCAAAHKKCYPQRIVMRSRC